MPACAPRNASHAAAPKPDFAFECALVKALVDAFSKRLVLSAHDVALGGLLVTVAEMAIASAPFDVGASLDLSGAVSSASPAAFSEMGGIVVEVSEASWSELQTLLKDHDVDWIEIGNTVAADTGFEVALKDGGFNIPLEALRTAHAGKLAEILYG